MDEIEDEGKGSKCQRCCVSYEPDHSTTILIFIVMDILATEIGLGYLTYYGIPAKYHITMFHRIVVWLSLVSTIVINCITKKSSEREKLVGTKTNHLEIVVPAYPVLFCVLYLVSTLMLLITVQDDFQYWHEVIVKIITILLDMILTLLFTKSAVDELSRCSMISHPLDGDEESSQVQTKSSKNYKYSLLKE